MTAANRAKLADKVGTGTGIYEGVADAITTYNDVAQHKGTVQIAHDVENDMWDIVNAASPIKKAGPLASVGIDVVEKKATATAEDALSNLIYNAFYKP